MPTTTKVKPYTAPVNIRPEWLDEVSEETEPIVFDALRQKYGEIAPKLTAEERQYAD